MEELQSPVETPQAILARRPSRPSQVDTASLAQLIASLVAAIGLLGFSALFALQAVNLFSEGNTEQLLASSLLVTGMGFSALLLLPSAWFALLRLTGRRPASTLPEKFPRRTALLIALLVIMPVTLVVGSYLVDESKWAWLLMPPFQILAVTIPVVWLIHLGCYQLPLGSAQRKWGIFSVSLVLGPIVIIILEIVVGAFFVLGALALLMTQPGFIDAFRNLIEQAGQNPALSPEQISSELLPYLQKPVVIYAAVVFLAVAVPLLEEMIKPLSIWFLGGRKLSPPEGFALGVLCGAGFAMMENLGYSAAAQGHWGGIALARSGTAVMHIVTSAMMGWALTSTWRDGRYLRVAGIYLAAVFIHGFWNGLTVSFGLLGAQVTGMLDSVILFEIGAAGTLGLLLLVLLVVMNSTMRRAIIPPPAGLPPVGTPTLNEEYQNNGISASTD